MKKLVGISLFFFTFISAQDMIVRVYVHSRTDLERIDAKPLDIAAGQYDQWYDLVADHEIFNKIAASGLPYEVTVHSLEYAKEQVRGTYLSYTQINDSLRQLALNYPSLCAFDSLPYTTFEGRWIYGVKISDYPQIDEDEPGFMIDGCHHSREWATPQAVLFFADSMLRSYGEVPGIAEVINTTQLYCFPIINVDGYVYDYPAGLSWRKNREPFGGATGTDCNRNYGGGCSGAIDSYWGAVDEGQATHYPSSATFCGAFAHSGDEIQAYTQYVRDKQIVTGFSLHSYGEMVMYPWGYTGQPTPDGALYDAKGAYMASMMQRLYSGTYAAGPSYYNPYATSGSTTDWVYGYNHYVAGLSTLFYGAEIGTAFYQNQSQLDNISRQVFKAAEYLAGFADSLIVATEGVVPAPAIYPVGYAGADFEIAWHARNTAHNNPLHWELLELSGPSVIEDDLESGTDRWVLQGFTLSTSQAHSATHSFFSGNINEMNHAVQTIQPYLVGPDDSITFWCSYNLENNYDVVVVEASENTKEWFNLDTARINGNSGGWVRKAYALGAWSGRSVYLRFRAMTDGNTLNGGFYVDDISPVCLFGTVDTVSSAIVDTAYAFTDHAAGEYYYLVRGYNSAWGWGDFSCLERVEIGLGAAGQDLPAATEATLSLALAPNPFVDRLQINYALAGYAAGARLCIYDAAGRMVADLSAQLRADGQPASIVWAGRDGSNRAVPDGVYFVRLDSGDRTVSSKAILQK